ncbi:MarR family winged helix-turn-helix transcriptional regulator [Sediminitomix flava]|uniref:DNA-binding MarR family transcriptional regulator n=1 Tax=Sediminitomix flava TaxID=379075 RepID=A0A316A2D4_SEDFL|nr:MarR family transcriptional regulator [Sediminitomix flava]PWJ43857.1 DNA-binding MarR family transcriptional regulator [Sediminitomix flava]
MSIFDKKKLGNIFHGKYYLYICFQIEIIMGIDEEIKTNFQNDRHRFIANLVFTSNWFQNRFIEFLRPFGISPQQMNILRILKGANDWVSMNQIKSLMIDKAPNATRLSDKMLDKGLVKRKRSEEDRRVVYLAIDKAGEDLLEAIDEADNGEQIEFLNKITEEEARMFSEILDKLRS